MGQAVLLGLALAVMIAALLRSLSRGGLAALVMATAVVLVLLAVSGRLGRWEVVAFALVAALGLVLFLWVGPGPALEHFRKAESLQSEPSFFMRVAVWEATLGAFRDFPVFGSGLGTFSVLFLHYYPAGTETLWDQAHNDYVQLMAEVGIAGLIPVALGLLVFLGRILSPLVKGAKIRERYVYYSMVTAILAVLIHATVDFGLQIPANGALFVVVCALALAHRMRQPQAAPTEG